MSLSIFRSRLPGILWSFLSAMLLVTSAACGPGRNQDKMVMAVESRMAVVQDAQLPGPVLDAVSKSNVLILGEEHYVQEHQEFIGALLPVLHKLGYRLLLTEQAHAFGWISEDYVLGTLDEIPWPLKAFDGLLLEKVRQFNSTLAMDERIRVQAIDINHLGFGDSLQFLKNRIETRDLFEILRVKTPEQYPPALEKVRERLVSEKDYWIEQWSRQWYDRVCELVEIELATIPIRSNRDPKNQSADREKLMILLAERRITETRGKVAVNCGQTHAQKKHFRDWYPVVNYQLLGMYLRGKYHTYHVAFWGAQGEKKQHFYDAECVKFNRLKDCPQDDLVRILAEKAENRIVVLPLDTDVFAESATAAGKKTSPSEQFDAWVLYPRITLLQSMKDEPRLSAKQ